MDYLDILKSSKEEADNTPQEVIRAELSKKLEPDVRKIYNKNLYELWHGDDLCEYVRAKALTNAFGLWLA